MDETKHSALFDAINRRDDDLLRIILENHGYPQGAATHHGRTPLTQVACLGSAQAVQLLLDHGAPIDQMDKDDDWPLQMAIWSENEEATRCLLRNGADTDLSNDAGLTCDGAAEDRFPQALAWLAEARAKRQAIQMDEATAKTVSAGKSPRL